MEISLDADDEAGLEGLWVWAESREAHAIRKGMKIRFTARILTQAPIQNTFGDGLPFPIQLWKSRPPLRSKVERMNTTRDLRVCIDVNVYWKPLEPQSMTGHAISITSKDPASQEKSMQRKGGCIKNLRQVVVLGATWQAEAQDPKTPYPSMAPFDQYLMERTAEIARARSAAPESISQDAEVRVLGQHSYETVVKGKNGFVVVERSWTAGTDDPDFWNPKVRAPDLLQPAGRAIPPFIYSQENRGDIGFAIQRPDVRGRQSRFRQEGIADVGIRRDVLHDVKARVLERS
jgi:hypothetical protein